MKKEHFKNIVLVALIITNFMLSQRIFANKKLWLFGYNFFVNMGNSLKNDDYITTLHITYPEKIFVNTGYQSSRFVYTRGSGEFSKIYEKIEPIILSAFSLGTKTPLEISKDEWFSVLSGKSLYLSFGCEYSSQIYSQLLGVSQNNITLDTFSHMVISESGDLYIKDNKNEKYYRVMTTDSSVKTIIEQVMTNNPDTESVINYSYELNFDKDFGDQKTFISPMVPVYATPFLSKVVASENPLMRGDEVNSNVINKILSVFSINPNTVRRYTEADGTSVYVENNGILRISRDGIISFTANDTGIELEDSGHKLIPLARFIDSINSASGSRKDMTLTSSVTSDTTSYTFDYIINGLPVKHDNTSAVIAKIENGYLKEYTHILRSYSFTGQESPAPMFIESLDETILSYQDSMNQIQIKKMYPAYHDNLSAGDIYEDWHIEINDVIAE